MIFPRQQPTFFFPRGIYSKSRCLGGKRPLSKVRLKELALFVFFLRIGFGRCSASYCCFHTICRGQINYSMLQHLDVNSLATHIVWANTRRDVKVIPTMTSILKCDIYCLPKHLVHNTGYTVGSKLP